MLRNLMSSPTPPRHLYEQLRAKNPQLADQFDTIYREASEVWNEQYLRTFTTHGEQHTKRVERNLDELTRPLPAGGGLSAEEIFVLLSACCLHDIGMQLADDPQARTKHAQYSYELILNSEVWIDSEHRRVTLSINDDNARRAIALIARGHWTEYALALPAADYIAGNERGRLRLLGLLLAMADLLDISPVRARYFRSIHRLFDLPPVSELHQKMHRLVRGFQIYAPNPAVTGDLQFRLDWRDNSDVVRRMSDWVMKWFDSQWRQLAPALYDASNGTIRWEKPWAEVAFHPLEGPPMELSPEALKILEAEMAQQALIDRIELAKQFQEAIASTTNTLFMFPVSSDMDGIAFSTWCETQARTHADCLVARVDVKPEGAFDVASIVSHLLAQWGVNLPACTNEEALDAVEDFVSSNGSHCLVSIIVANRFRIRKLRSLLKLLLRHRRGQSAKPRICLLLTDEQDHRINELGGVQIRRIVADQFTRSDVLEYLQNRLGYQKDESLRLYDKMSQLRHLEGRAGVYDYLNLHCGLSSEPYIIEE